MTRRDLIPAGPLLETVTTLHGFRPFLTGAAWSSRELHEMAGLVRQLAQCAHRHAGRRILHPARVAACDLERLAEILADWSGAVLVGDLAGGEAFRLATIGALERVVTQLERWAEGTP